jgi:hypothetical protein
MDSYFWNLFPREIRVDFGRKFGNSNWIITSRFFQNSIKNKVFLNHISDDAWKPLRKQLNPFFNIIAIQKKLPLFEEECNKVAKKINYTCVPVAKSLYFF